MRLEKEGVPALLKCISVSMFNQWCESVGSRPSALNAMFRNEHLSFACYIPARLWDSLLS